MATEQHPDHVTVAYWAEYESTRGDDECTETFTWDEWAEMTAQQRQDTIDSLAEGLASCAGGYGGEVRGPQPEPAPDLPAMPPLPDLALAIKASRRAYIEQVVIGLTDWTTSAADRDQQRAHARKEWNRRNPVLVAVLVHVDAARDARQAAHERAKAAEQ